MCLKACTGQCLIVIEWMLFHEKWVLFNKRMREGFEGGVFWWYKPAISSLVSWRSLDFIIQLRCLRQAFLGHCISGCVLLLWQACNRSKGSHCSQPRVCFFSLSRKDLHLEEKLLSPFFQSTRSSYQFCGSTFKQLQLHILNFVALAGAPLSVSLTFFSEVSFCWIHPACSARL